MSPYLKITLRTFTMWILASFINGMLCATYISITDHVFGGLPAAAVLIFFASLFFSAPGFLIFWIILLIKLGNRVYERALFRIALSTGFIMAATTAIIAVRAFDLALSDSYVFALFIISSAIISIMIHFNHFKQINN